MRRNASHSAQSTGYLALTIVLTMTQTYCAPLNQYSAKRHIAAGQARLASDNLNDALIEFQRAIRLAPQLPDAHSGLGNLYRRMGNYDQAIDSYQEAIRLNPFSFIDAVNLAQVYQFTQRLVEAIRAYLHASELRPADFDVQLNLGVCYQQTGDTLQAVERFQKAIEIDPDRPQGHVNLAVALDAQGKYYEAIRAYKEALERDNRQPQVLVNLAKTYMNQDRLKLARHTLMEAVDLDPTLAAAHEALGYCLFRSRDFGAAERRYLRALECDRRLPNSQAGLGSIYMLRFLEDESQTQYRERALEHWHRSLELQPDQPRIRALIQRYTTRHQEPDAMLLSDPPRPWSNGEHDRPH